MANSNNKQIFKEWVPTWLVYLTLFIFLLPLASVLGIYMGAIPTAAGFYGVNTSDIRFSVVVYYIAIASIFPLEAKFFSYFSSKPYLVSCVLIYILINVINYFTRNFTLFLVLRYLGGAISHGAIGIIFTLVFKQFHEQRSRVLGYATMYSVLFGSAPFSYILDANLFSDYDFNSLFLFKIFSILPGIIMMCLILRNDIDLRRIKKNSLKKSVDLISYLLYTSGLLSLAYFFLYGQLYNWFQSFRIQFTLSIGIFFLVIFILRQGVLKEPYINFRVYRTRNFRIGMLMLVFFYLAKGDMGILTSFVTHSVNLDGYHYGYVMMMNALGIVIGALLGGRYVLAGMRIRIIWMLGFGALLGYHIFSLAVLNNQAEARDLLIPLFLQGFGNGILIISIVIFYVTAVPPELGPSASVSGVGIRATTFSGSMALTSVLGLRFNKIHFERFGNSVTEVNPLATERIKMYRQALLNKGLGYHESTVGAIQQLGKSIQEQDSLLFIKDYYLYMTYMLFLVILLIATIPHFSYQIKKIKAKFIPL